MNTKTAGAIVLLLLLTPLQARAQSAEPSPAVATSPPKLLLLVHQTFQPGKASTRAKLEVAIARACDHFAVPNSWIDLEAVTGPREALFFDPFGSFEEMDKAAAAWPKIFGDHPQLTRLQEELEATIASERTIIAVRRDDVGYRANTIDLSKARTIRLLEVCLHPGHENDFIEAFKVLGGAYEKINSDTPWVVYQVNAGMPSPSFLVFVPMKAMRQNDDLLARRQSLQDAEGAAGVDRMQQIAREAYASTESEVYAVSPERSYVLSDFAAGDPEFWNPKVSESTKPATPLRKRRSGRKR